MGNEQGKPLVNRASAEYVAAKERFHVITGETEIITEKTATEKEADRLLDILDALGPPMPPLLPSGLENSILKSKKDLAIQHELERGTYGGSKKCPVPIRNYTPVIASLEENGGTAANHLLPPPPMQTDGVEVSSFYQLLGTSQTVDRREAADFLSLQEAMLSSLAQVKYSTQKLRYDYNMLLTELQSLDEGLRGFLADVEPVLGQLSGWTPSMVCDAGNSPNSNSNNNMLSRKGTLDVTVGDIAALVLEIDAYLDPEERLDIQKEVAEKLAEKLTFS